SAPVDVVALVCSALSIKSKMSLSFGPEQTLASGLQGWQVFVLLASKNYFAKHAGRFLQRSPSA
ncbi:MAG: hypothetical protein V2I33_19920, partial [Kangiellaceae bacterium]|nr:hypothetical protein [Kangiellaceae bacterium]